MKIISTMYCKAHRLMIYVYRFAAFLENLYIDKTKHEIAYMVLYIKTSHSLKSIGIEDV